MQLYERKYPETKQGSTGGWHNNKTGKLETEMVSVSSDTADAATKTGTTGRGGPGRGNKTTETTSAVSFAADTATKTGQKRENDTVSFSQGTAAKTGTTGRGGKKDSTVRSFSDDTAAKTAKLFRRFQKTLPKRLAKTRRRSQKRRRTVKTTRCRFDSERGHAEKQRQDVVPFSDDTANKTGQSRRSVERK